MSLKRIIEIDIVKGILIILVIIGHLPTSLREYIYQFHMPAFFIVSGFFLPSPAKLNLQHLKRQLQGLLRPYLVYLVIIGIPFLFFMKQPFNLPNLAKLVIGGRALYDATSPFWFITALGGGYILHYIIETKIHNSTLKLLIISIFYLLSLLESLLFTQFHVLFYTPLAIDVSLMVVCYLFIGKFLGKKLIKLNENNRLIRLLFIVSTVLIGLFLILQRVNILSYSLDMKYVKYNHPLFDLIVGPIYVTFLFSLSKVLKPLFKFLRLDKVGTASLTIMYLHMPILICTEFINQISIRIILAIISSTFLHYFFNNYSQLSYYLLGKKDNRIQN